MEYSIICKQKFTFARFDKTFGKEVSCVRISNTGNYAIFWKVQGETYFPVAPFDVMEIPEPYKGVLFIPRYAQAMISYTFIGDGEPIILNDTLTGVSLFIYEMLKEGGKLSVKAVYDNFGQKYGLKSQSAKIFRILFSSELVKEDDFFILKNESYAD